MSNNNTLVVEVEEGKLQGVEKKSELTDKPFYAFLGIPYAKPPVGDLRFRAPLPADKWEGTRDASKEGENCLQSAGPSKSRGSEDCLYINVCTPQPPSDIVDKKPVMVYIHGGGFTNGTGSLTSYGPDFFIGDDVVFATLQYRLHVLGFLNTGTPSCPGNAGLKDQQLALTWIKKNIAKFGGDPENITLFGESAGAASVSLQMLSPLSKGLFHRAIIQSGNCFVPWALTDECDNRARHIGKLAGYDGDDMEELVKRLKELSGDDLCQLAKQCHTDSKTDQPGRCGSVVFIPSVEKIKEGAFLPDTPEELMKTAPRMPLIAGYCNQEGVLCTASQLPEILDMIVEDPTLVVKNNFRLSEGDQAELLKEISQFYFDNQPWTPDGVIKLYTDLYYIKFFESIGYLVNSDVPPHVFLFPYDGTFNFVIKRARQTYNLSVVGAAHGDDVPYIFWSTQHNMDEATETDLQVIKNMCSIWVDFAKYGNPIKSLPDVDWKPHVTDRPCYIELAPKLTVFNEKLYAKRHAFWKKWSDAFVRALP